MYLVSSSKKIDHELRYWLNLWIPQILKQIEQRIMLQSLFIRYQKQTTICWSRSLNALENLSHMCHARLIHYKFLTTYRRCWSSAPVCRGGHSARTEPACDSCSSLGGSSGSRPPVRPTSGSPRRNCPSLSASGQAPVLYTVANHYDDLLENSYTSKQW